MSKCSALNLIKINDLYYKMIYPYITNLNKYKDQIILEICNEHFNYRVILKPEYLFDDDFIILSQKYAKTEGKKKYSLYDLYKTNLIDFNTNLRLLRIVNI